MLTLAFPKERSGCRVTSGFTKGQSGRGEDGTLLLGSLASQV